MEKIAHLSTIRYLQHAPDLYEVVLLEANRKSVEELFTCIYEIYMVHPPETRLKFLANNGHTGALPIQSLIPQLRSFSQHPFRPSAVAVILPQSPVSRVITAMIDVLPITRQNRIRYYHLEEYDQALEWVKNYSEPI
ncbi:MAG: hypothetical protein MUF87_09425 [Anaerolineae bacterium]|jgi:hypothetical protein|nr:hypothetical protein [Anaerolineae bacterium]